MIDLIYEVLETIGYPKPLHPSMTHVSVGLVVAIFILALIAVLFRRHMLSPSAYRRLLILTLIFALVAIFTGFTDWQHFYGGAWLIPIQIKVALSGLVLVFLLLGLFYGIRSGGESKKSVLIYVICLLSVIGLGYFGGDLIWGERIATSSEGIGRFRPGEKLFSKYCDVCHQGATEIVASPRFDDFGEFLTVLRNPEKAGFPEMPAFPLDEISEDEAMALYHYLILVYVSNVLRPSGD